MQSCSAFVWPELSIHHDSSVFTLLPEISGASSNSWWTYASSWDYVSLMQAWIPDSFLIPAVQYTPQESRKTMKDKLDYNKTHALRHEVPCARPQGITSDEASKSLTTFSMELKTALRVCCFVKRHLPPHLSAQYNRIYSRLLS